MIRQQRCWCKKANLNSIVIINIEEIKNEIWQEISELDVV